MTAIFIYPFLSIKIKYSENIAINIGVPQGTVLDPFLLTMQYDISTVESHFN